MSSLLGYLAEFLLFVFGRRGLYYFFMILFQTVQDLISGRFTDKYTKCRQLISNCLDPINEATPEFSPIPFRSGGYECAHLIRGQVF